MSMPIDDKTRLSRTQVVILWMLARGFPVKKIAVVRGITTRSVLKAIEAALVITGAESRDELIFTFRSYLFRRQWTRQNFVIRHAMFMSKQY